MNLCAEDLPEPRRSPIEMGRIGGSLTSIFDLTIASIRERDVRLICAPLLRIITQIAPLLLLPSTAVVPILLNVRRPTPRLGFETEAPVYPYGLAVWRIHPLI